MGKDEKEETGFGFKDKAKAEETLKLLEQHDMNYRRLTVRGLLGRAKRVLSLTKAEDKIKNIKEAMEVFDNWLADLEKNKVDKTKKKEKDKGRDSSSKSSDEEMPEVERRKKDSPPPDTVPGLGFKDKETAKNSLEVLEGRDPDYQKLAVKGLIGRAKRVLTCTKDEMKINNIKEAMAVFDKFLDDFDTMHLSRQNNPYVSLGIVNRCLEIAKERGIGSEQQKAFICAYSKVKGEYKRLRTVEDKDGGQTWDILRNSALKSLKDKYGEAKLFNEKNEPTNEHLQMLLWAYSPDAARAKKYISESSGETNQRKRKSSGDEGAANERNRKSSGDSESNNERKRKSSGGRDSHERKRKSSDEDGSGERKRKSSDETSPKKKKE